MNGNEYAQYAYVRREYTSTRDAAKGMLALGLLNEKTYDKLVDLLGRYESIKSVGDKAAQVAATQISKAADNVYERDADPLAEADSIVRVELAERVAKIAAGKALDAAKAIVNDKADAIVPALNERIEFAKEQMRAAYAKLGDINNADQAIDAGLADEWATIRRAHATILNAHDSAVEFRAAGLIWGGSDVDATHWAMRFRSEPPRDGSSAFEYAYVPASREEFDESSRNWWSGWDQQHHIEPRISAQTEGPADDEWVDESNPEGDEWLDGLNSADEVGDE